MKLFFKIFLLRLIDFYLLKCLVFKTFAFMELISFNSIYEFFFLLFFSSVSLKLSEAIQIFRLAEVLFKGNFGSLGI